MSKEFKNIDQLFQRELGSLHAKAPAHVKANIDKAIGVKKSRKGWWFFLIPLIVIAVAVPSVIHLLPETNQQEESWVQDENENLKNDHQLLTPDQQNESSSAGENTSFDSNDKQNFIKQTVESSSDKSLQKINDQNNSTHQSTESKNNTTNPNLQSNKITSQTNNNQHINENANQTNNSKTETSFESQVEQNNFVQNQENNMSTNDNSEEKSNKESLNAEEENEQQSTQSSTTKEPTDLSDAQQKDSNKENQSSNHLKDNDLASDSTTSELAENDILPEEKDSIGLINTDQELKNQTDTTELSNTVDTDTAQKSTTELEHDILPNQEKIKPWMLTVFGGSAFKKSNIITGNDTLDAEYGQLNDRPGFAVGVDVNYRLKQGLLFGAGIAYSSQSENYDYSKSEYTIVDSNVTWNVFIADSIVDSLGTTYIYDSTSTTTPIYGTQEIYNQQGINKTSYLHIPFRFGFQFILQKKWRFDAYAQGRFNVLLNTNAVYIENNNIVNSTLKNSYFDLEIGGAAHYNVWKNLYVSGVFRYRPPLRNPYYSASIQNKMQYLYLGAGVSLTF